MEGATSGPFGRGVRQAGVVVGGHRTSSPDRPGAPSPQVGAVDSWDSTYDLTRTSGEGVRDKIENGLEEAGHAVQSLNGCPLHDPQSSVQDPGPRT